MLGSVFNRHQASTSAEPSRARLRTFRVGKDTHPFSEFRGLGSPGLDIGLPGDIYIDITPGLHALYARYPESWLLWPGPKDTSIRTLLLHPVQSDRCLWCHDSIGWFQPRHIRVNPIDASELLSTTLEYQAKLLEESKESKKRKRDAPHQPIRPKSTSASSLSPNRNSLENQSPTDALSFSPTISYSQPAHEIMTPDPPIIQNYRTTSPITDSRQHSVPTVIDHLLTSNNPNERPERNLQEQHTLPRRIDLRTVAFGDAKLRLFAKLQKRRASSPTRPRSVLYPADEEQSLPYQTLIHDSETSRIFRNNDTSPDQSTQSNSAAMFTEPSVNDADLQPLSTKPIPFNITRKTFVTDLLHPAPFASTDSVTATHRNHVDKETVSFAITQLRKIKAASEANAANLRAANDKIRHLESENAKLRAQLLSQCQCNLPSTDVPLMVETPDSDALNGTFEKNSKQSLNAEGPSQPPRELVSPWETVTNTPSSSQLFPRDNPCEEELESNSAPRHSATPSTSLLLANTVGLTEARGSVCASPAESATVECRSTMDTLKVEANSSSLAGCNSSESNMDTCPLVKGEIYDTNSWHASPVPTSTLFPMREIHRSVLFAKAGSLSICRICLGTKSGGIETVDQAFQTSEELPEVMQEHCEKEHPDEYEALMNMRDEDLLDVVLKISSEC